MATTATVNPYLAFNGNAREAIEFYHDVIGGELNIQTFGEAPMDSSPELENNIMHAHLQNGALEIMASDSMPGQDVQFGDSVNVSIVGPDEGELKRWFEGLSAGGTVTMPLEKQFWGDTFGMFTDKFGINWMVNVLAAEHAETQEASQAG
jgi:PhnB protein